MDVNEKQFCEAVARKYLEPTPATYHSTLTAIADMKNTTHYRQMNFDSRCFFDVYGGADDGTHDDLNYKTTAIDILDGNTQTTPKVEARTLSDQEKTIVESLFSDGTPVEDAMTQIKNSPELKTLVSLHPDYKALVE